MVPRPAPVVTATAESGRSDFMSGLEIFFLVCFLVGVMLSSLSFVGGSFHLPHFHVHVPHIHVNLHAAPPPAAPPVTGGVQSTAVRTGSPEAHMPAFNFA